MKENYRKLIKDYLDLNLETVIKCNPKGWHNHKFSVNGYEFSDRAHIADYLNNNALEHLLLYKFINEKITHPYVSYKLLYNKEKELFEGTLKQVGEKKDIVNLDFDIPENIWFDNLNLQIYIHSRNKIDVTINCNIKNGMIPPDTNVFIEELKKSMKNKITNALKNIKGRVSGCRLRQVYNYSKNMKVEFVIDPTIYNEKKLSIKL